MSPVKIEQSNSNKSFDYKRIEQINRKSICLNYQNVRINFHIEFDFVRSKSFFFKFSSGFDIFSCLHRIWIFALFINRFYILKNVVFWCHYQFASKLRFIFSDSNRLLKLCYQSIRNNRLIAMRMRLSKQILKRLSSFVVFDFKRMTHLF